MNAISESLKSTIIAMVVSNNMDKTAVVSVERKVKHKTYGKYIKRSSKRQIHDPDNQCEMGDLVRIRESRPYSKNKRWELVEILKNKS